MFLFKAKVYFYIIILEIEIELLTYYYVVSYLIKI